MGATAQVHALGDSIDVRSQREKTNNLKAKPTSRLIPVNNGFSKNQALFFPSQQILKLIEGAMSSCCYSNSEHCPLF